MPTLLEMARAQVVPGAPGSGFTYTQPTGITLGAGLRRTPETFDPNPERRAASSLAYLSSMSWDNPGKFNAERHAQLTNEIMGELAAKAADPSNKYRNIVVGDTPGGAYAAYESFRKLQEANRQFNVQAAMRAQEAALQRQMDMRKLALSERALLSDRDLAMERLRLSAAGLLSERELAGQKLGLDRESLEQSRALSLYDIAARNRLRADTEGQAGIYSSALGEGGRQHQTLSQVASIALKNVGPEALKIAKEHGLGVDLSKGTPVFSVLDKTTPDAQAKLLAATTQMQTSPSLTYLANVQNDLAAIEAQQQRLIQQYNMQVRQPGAIRVPSLDRFAPGEGASTGRVWTDQDFAPPATRAPAPRATLGPTAAGASAYQVPPFFRRTAFLGSPLALVILSDLSPFNVPDDWTQDQVAEEVGRRRGLEIPPSSLQPREIPSVRPTRPEGFIDPTLAATVLRETQAERPRLEAYARRLEGGATEGLPGFINEYLPGVGAAIRGTANQVAGFSGLAAAYDEAARSLAGPLAPLIAPPLQGLVSGLVSRGAQRVAEAFPMTGPASVGEIALLTKYREPGESAQLSALSNILQFGAGTAAEQIPQLLAGGAVSRGLQVAGMAPKGAAALGSMLTTAPQEATGIYEELREQGVRPEVAFGIGAPLGLLSGYLERFGDAPIIERALSRGIAGKSLLAEVLKSAAGEAATEMAQEGIAIGGRALAGKPVSLGEAVERVATAGLGGAFGGGLITGTTEGVSRAFAPPTPPVFARNTAEPHAG